MRLETRSENILQVQLEAQRNGSSKDQNYVRVKDAVHLVLSKRSPDGKWLLEGDWSREPEAQENKRKALVEVEELWKPSKWVTLNAFRALSAATDRTDD